MKALIQNSKHFLNFYKFKQQPLCLGELKSCWRPRYLSWATLLQTVILLRQQIRQRLRLSARPVILAGLHVLANVAREKVLGYVLLVVGAVTIFAHQLFFNEAVRDYTWIYRNWYYFMFTNRLFLVMIFWSAGFMALVPQGKRLATIPVLLFQSAGWIGFIHNSFFVQTNDQFRQWPHWSVWVMGASFAVGIITTVKFQIYWWHHKVRANHARFVGVAEMKLSAEEKAQMGKLLAEEYREINKLI